MIKVTQTYYPYNYGAHRLMIGAKSTYKTVYIKIAAGKMDVPVLSLLSSAAIYQRLGKTVTMHAFKVHAFKT